MQRLSFYKSPLSIFGLILLVGGLIFNIKMFVKKEYPTYLFFILMVDGIAFILLDILIRKLKLLTGTSKLIIQISLIVLPIFAIYLKFSVLNPRAEVIIAPKGFEGPIAIIYSIPEFPKIERKNRDLIIRLPQSGIFITSSEPPKSIKVETYVEVDTKDSGYGREIGMPLGGTGGAYSSKCGKRYKFSYGYLTDKLEHELAFDRESFTNKLSEYLCNKGILSKN